MNGYLVAAVIPSNKVNREERRGKYGLLSVVKYD